MTLLAEEFKWLNGIEQKQIAQEERLRQLEKHIHFPNTTAALASMKESAARAQCSLDHVPMRTDVETIRTLTAFAKRLLNTEDFGHAVTFEVRQAARRALGLPEVKEYDL
jgi:hypothetical protein